MVKKNNAIAVKLGTRSYAIEYAQNLTTLSASLPKVQGKEFALIDANVEKYHGKALKAALPQITFLRIPHGERSKSFRALENLANALVREGATRHSRLYAIGGGVVGDLTGFLAGVFMRGISFVQIPTTLLAMVDSSVGGKTAVNIAAGKNLVGVIHQPQHVFIHMPFLKTLPQRELRCGLSESIKTALIYDKKLIKYLEKFEYNPKKIPTEFLAHLSLECIRTKATIVSKDEKEQNIRAFLNFGHTLAHAIEAKLQYKKVLHGEAVAIGQRFAALLSRRLGFLTKEDELRIENLLHKFNLPTRLKDAFPNGVNPTLLLNLMYADKKNRGREIRFVLLSALGKAQLPQKVEEQELLASLKEFQMLA
ncbi:MAG TPA: 3-dehydroquinate synthase [Turneriella sp.]|nr:3-dehydroquinate synthase [Turneriella sp.]